ncbi:retrovirus-related pol polyprotein from transposon TNT 1-94 [Tanacetum coccineum]
MALGYQNPFYLKQAQQKQQSLYNGKVLLEKHDPPTVYDSEETLQLAQESRLKMKQLNKGIKSANYTKINHLLRVFVSQTAKLREELHFSNTSKTANVSKPISIPNEEFSDNTTPKADESLAKHKALELEIERLLRAVVSQDIMSIVQNPSVVDSSNLQTELDRTKERFENCIIKKENEYAKLWNDWYKKCEECKYDKISYDKAYNDMQEKIKQLQAQLGDQKGKSKDTPYVSNTLDPLSQKLENENIELEFQGLPKIDKTHALSKPVTSNSVPTPQELKVVNNDKVIAPGMFRINPFKPSREENNTKNDRIPSASKSSCSKNKEVEVEEHLRNLLLFKNKKHMSSKCNNIKLAIRNAKSEVVCAICYLNLFMFLGTVRFGNDHVAVILGFDDLQWGNILITMVYFIEGLGHNLFLVGQFYDSDLEQGKSKRASHPPKLVPNSKQRLHLLHMDLCGPMRIASINGKWYVLVIMDDYSRYTWVYFLKSKDEAPEVIKTFLKRITVLHQSLVIIVRTDNSTKFKNQILKEYFDSVGISRQASSVRAPQQNGVVERRNRTLVEAARTMLIFSYAPLFLWVEAIATAALCYPKNDHKDIGKLGTKGDIGFFIGYSADSCAYRVYNRRTKKIIETMNVTFDDLSAMAFEQSSSKLGLQSMTSRQISSGLDLTYAPSTITTQQPTEGELDLLFKAMYDDYIGGQPLAALRTTPAAQVPQVLQTLTKTTTTADTALTPTNSSSQATNFPNTSEDVD